MNRILTALRLSALLAKYTPKVARCMNEARGLVVQSGMHAPPKTDMPMVLYARGLAWFRITLVTLVKVSFAYPV